MESKTKIKLTSAEITILWNTYMSDTMSICIHKHFLVVVKDSEIGSILEFSLKASQEHIEFIADIFTQEGYPIPLGFTDKDVNSDAPALYTETFTLFNLRYLSRIGLNYFSIALPQMARQDMVDFLTRCIHSAAELTRRLISLKIARGIYVRPPEIMIPSKAAFIDSRDFTAGFFTEKRRMISSEVTQLFLNTQANIIGKALLTGFAQVTESQKIKDNLIKGINISKKHIEVFGNKLKDEDIPVSMPSDTFVTKSTEAPFSDKLVMYKLALINAAGFENYAIATSTCMRHDLQADFVRLAAETAKYEADGLNIMIDNKWMEQPPQTVSYLALSKV